MSKMRSLLAAMAAALLVPALVGCARRPGFPNAVAVRTLSDERAYEYDIDHDGRLDYWQFQAAGGRKHALAYRTAGQDGPGDRIDLDAIDARDCPHYIIALDGVPFEIVDELYRAGNFRLFHPPARVVCCFPAMTDLALADVFQSPRCRAFQALYFDRVKNHKSDSTAVYLSGGDSPWLTEMDYRCSLWWDTLVYLNPHVVFDHELAAILRTFRRIDTGEGRAYSVGSAGLGTRGGRDAIRDYLGAVDELCERIVYERHGRAKITLLADHGHNLTQNRRVEFDALLRAGGYHPAASLHEPRDVVTISYGLVTYADFYTDDPAGVAQCLLQSDAVEFACYPQDDAVVVVGRAGGATIRRGRTGFTYDAARGDPLLLRPIVEQLRAQGQVSMVGEIDEKALFAATVDHYYPDPLARVWRAFHGLVEHAPDLIVNLRDGSCHGSGFFYAMVGGTVASTHGALNRANSTTFALTMLGELPAAMPSAAVLPALEKLRDARPAR